MRAGTLVLAFALQAAAAASLAQEASDVAKVPPEANNAFLAAVQEVFRDHPEAAGRYRLVDVGPEPRWDVSWDCEDIGDHIIDCSPVAEAEQ
jgi:ABC-type sugar transport system substrate-binding protein